ncbi:hypothetical protein GCM10010431_66790 [Streptomyces kunmingensis]
MLEDYRAGLTVDRRHEESDRARGARIDCPVLVLWSLRDDLEDLYGDPRTIWRDWADDVRDHEACPQMPGTSLKTSTNSSPVPGTSCARAPLSTTRR